MCDRVSRLCLLRCTNLNSIALPPVVGTIVRFPTLPYRLVPCFLAGECQGRGSRRHSMSSPSNRFIVAGDLASARLVLQRAAEAGDPRAALMLAGTFDPIVLEKIGIQA